jgi:hypothetical protein
MKTVKEWLETLDEPYRSQALENLLPEYASILEYSVNEALLGAFTWVNSPQGYEYWADYEDSLG